MSMRLPVAMLLAASALWGQAPSAAGPSNLEGRTIVRIDFEPAEQQIPRSELDRVLPFKVGDSLKSAAVREAIDKLYATGRYTDLSIEGSLEGDAVAVKIVTVQSEFIGRVAVDGESPPPSNAQLSTATKLEAGAVFEEAALTQAKAALLERLRANGFYSASAWSQVAHSASNGTADVSLHIKPGTRARFGGLKLTGMFGEAAEKALREAGWKRSFAGIRMPGWRDMNESRLQSGISKIRESLLKNDRLRSKVTLTDIDYDATRNAVTPAVAVELGPIVSVRTDGAKVPKKTLRQLVPVYQEQAVDEGLLVEGRRNILEYFQSRGYFDVDADFYETEPEPGRTVIQYNITPGAKHSLTRLTITGNHYFDTETLRERLNVETASLLRYRRGRYSRALLEKDRSGIENLYKANGFKEVKVTAKVEDNAGGIPDHLVVSIEIEEGPQYLVASLEIAGVPDADAERFKKTLQSIPGQPYTTSAIASDRDFILSYYYDNGYPDAAFDWTEEASDEDNAIDLRFELRLGAREFLRAALVRGLNTTKPALVESRLGLKPGSPLSLTSVAAAQQRLYELGIFSKVETAVQNPDGVEESKNVLFNLYEAGRYSFNFGLGAEIARIGGGTTTFDAPAGEPGFSPRVSLGVTRSNVWGIGHSVSLQTRASTLEQRGLLSYLIPQFEGNERLSLSFSALYDDSTDVRTFAAKREEGSVQIAEKISRSETLQVRYAFRHVSIDPNSLKISPELIPLLSQPVRVGIVSLSFVQDRRDDPADSHRGVYNTVDAGVALRQLGSETDFTRLLFRNSTYHPLTKSLGRGVVLARSLQFGYIQRLGGLAEIPLAERFFAGGASSHRAFPDNQAGPRDLETGFPLGGSALLFHSTELRFPLIGDNVGGVLFHDVGNVYSDIRDISFRFRQRDLQDFNYAVHSAGVGIRYKTPVGPIRVDLSYSPDSPRFFGFSGTLDQLLAGQGVAVNQRINSFQFHFSLGQTF